jgi:uncharacterized protein YlxW (UPF0749 family)
MMKRIGELKAERIHDLNQIGGLQQENARLKAEVERLEKTEEYLQNTLNQYALDDMRSQAQVERLTKAGDAMASMLQFEETLNDSDHIPQSVQRWNAAKEGKGQP